MHYVGQNVAVFTETLIVARPSSGGVNQLKLSKMCISLLGTSDS